MATPYRKLKVQRFRPDAQPAKSIGRRPDLVMLPVDRLVVDDTYQRPITPQGRSNILRIIETFDWRKFAPLIVVPVEDGLYAIIDGQHRATAALMHPQIDLVPCMVIEATTEDAAACFAAINGAVTTMQLGQMFHARVASGELLARSVHALCERAGVRVLRAKAGADAYRVGDTLAIGSIEALVKRHGESAVETALTAISANGNAGMLRADVIKAVTLCVVDTRASVEAAIAVLAEVDLRLRAGAAKIQADEAGEPVWRCLYRSLLPLFNERTGPAAADAREMEPA